jgi:molybdenum cofactor synthesis domain-containing protein
MIRAAIVTVSDRSASGEREDASGSRLAEAVRAVGGEVVSTSLVPDERAEIERELCRLADSERVPLILTTGGTGLASRDVTPESTLAVIQREAPGLAEHVRRTTVAQTEFAILSRGVCGIRRGSLIVNLPGSPKGAVEGFEALASVLPHALSVLANVAEVHPA